MGVGDGVDVEVDVLVGGSGETVAREVALGVGECVGGTQWSVIVSTADGSAASEPIPRESRMRTVPETILSVKLGTIGCTRYVSVSYLEFVVRMVEPDAARSV